MYRRFHWHLPTRHTIGVLVFAAILFFGPMVLLIQYDSPFPPRFYDFIGVWYAFGTAILLIVSVGPAHPKYRK